MLNSPRVWPLSSGWEQVNNNHISRTG